MIARFRYHLDLRAPLRMADKTYTHRDGLLLRYGSGEDSFVWADASPLPGFSTESLEDVLSARMSDIPEHLPSLRFAVDSLRQVSGLPFGAMPYVPVNALIGSAAPEEMMVQAEAAIQAGYKTLKVKIGRSFSDEFTFLEAFADRHPHIRLRLDANASLSLRDAIDRLPRLAEFKPEYLEQPVAGTDDLLALARVSPVPIAADESVRSRADAARVIRDGAVRVLILKPMMIGWWADTIAILEDAYRHDVACVLTTSLESAVGRRITAAFAARYAPLGHAHGLATGSLFTRDVIVKPDPIRNGDYHPESVSDIDSAMLEPVP